jgi:hypothetical protein
MEEANVLEELARLYLEIRELKERIVILESERQESGKPVLDGTPPYVRKFIEARNKLAGGDNNG